MEDLILLSLGFIEFPSNQQNEMHVRARLVARVRVIGFARKRWAVRARANHGERQSVETLINEEALLFAKYLRGETDKRVSRVPIFPFSKVVEWQLVC